MSLFDDPWYKVNQRLNDLERRIDRVYGGPKMGLSSVALDSGSAGFEVTSFGTDNWQDDASGGTTPEVTLVTGSRVMIFACFRPIDIGTDIGGSYDYRSVSGIMGIQIDSTEPQNFPLPPMRSQFAFSAAIAADSFAIWIPLTLSTFREDLEPGEHTFTMRYWCQDTSPTGTINPTMTDQFLMVLPLGFE